MKPLKIKHPEILILYIPPRVKIGTKWKTLGPTRGKFGWGWLCILQGKEGTQDTLKVPIPCRWGGEL